MDDADLRQGLFTLIEELSYTHVDIITVRELVTVIYKEGFFTLT